MSNLAAHAQISRIIDEVGFGKIELELETHNKNVVGFSLFGKKRHIYNQSAKDSANNQAAFRDILERLRQATAENGKSVVAYTVEVNKGKIRAVTWLTKMTQSVDSKK